MQAARRLRCRSRSIPANIAITPARINDACIGRDDADRARCHLRLRPWILWLFLVGAARCGRLPFRDAPQDAYAAAPDRGALRRGWRLHLRRPHRGHRRPARVRAWCQAPAGRYGAARDRPRHRRRPHAASHQQTTSTHPAADIAALYKARWQIELFFRWIKQHLKIPAFGRPPWMKLSALPDLGYSVGAVGTKVGPSLVRQSPRVSWTRRPGRPPLARGSSDAPRARSLDVFFDQVTTPAASVWEEKGWTSFINV